MSTLERAREASDPLEENLESLVAIQRQEELRRTVARRQVEAVSRVIGSPPYLAALSAFAVSWVGYNLLASKIQIKAFDLFPFPYWRDFSRSLHSLVPPWL
jgi:uncharacterized membrane protein